MFSQMRRVSPKFTELVVEPGLKHQRELMRMALDQIVHQPEELKLKNVLVIQESDYDLNDTDDIWAQLLIKAAFEKDKYSNSCLSGFDGTKSISGSLYECDVRDVIGGRIVAFPDHTILVFVLGGFDLDLVEFYANFRDRNIKFVFQSESAWEYKSETSYPSNVRRGHKDPDSVLRAVQTYKELIYLIKKTPNFSADFLSCGRANRRFNLKYEKQDEEGLVVHLNLVENERKGDPNPKPSELNTQIGQILDVVRGDDEIYGKLAKFPRHGAVVKYGSFLVDLITVAAYLHQDKETLVHRNQIEIDLIDIPKA